MLLKVTNSGGWKTDNDCKDCCAAGAGNARSDLGFRLRDCAVIRWGDLHAFATQKNAEAFVANGAGSVVVRYIADGLPNSKRSSAMGG